jgi:hypothetical protein
MISRVRIAVDDVACGKTMPMKFDAARASAVFEKLEDPAFSGPDSEGRIADFIAGELEKAGWKVERREVTGSRFPQRVGPWIGWLGYGALTTVGYLLMLGNDPLSIFVVLLLFLLTTRWLFDLLSNRIRPGRRRTPLETAPLLIGSRVGESPPPVRVVFQAVLGGLKSDFFQSFRQNRFVILNIMHLCIWVSIILTSAATLNPERSVKVAMVPTTSVLFFVLWVIILCVLSYEYDQWRSIGVADRRGLAALVELARSWPPQRSRQIESVFIAAGGQEIDYAGSREVLRILDAEWPRKPTLLVLFFAPGAGEAIRIGPVLPALSTLAKESAKSLWIPISGEDCWTLLRFWPFEDVRPIEPIALIGSDPKGFFDSSFSPEALHRAAQLATEIALRWAKKQTVLASAADAASSKLESSN